MSSESVDPFVVSVMFIVRRIIPEDKEQNNADGNAESESRNIEN